MKVIAKYEIFISVLKTDINHMSTPLAGTIILDIDVSFNFWKIEVHFHHVA